MKRQNRKNKYLCAPQDNSTMIPEKYVRFDWAIKRLLRDKANFSILEGLISVLLNEKITIVELLDSEANREDYEDKFNRVDIKAKNSKGEIIIVEVQQRRESDFLLRLLYGVSKSITEHIAIGEGYDKVKKIYSISILYFNFGKGADYLYHGKTTFTGVNIHDTLEITEKQQDALRIRTPEELFPEYFLVRVKAFDKVPENPLEEWLDYLKNGRIKDDTTTPGLKEARERLQYMMMSKVEQERYFRHIDNWKSERNAMETSRQDGLAEGMEKGMEKGMEEGMKKGRAEGKAEGLAEGLEKGKAEGKVEIARTMLTDHIEISVIAKFTGLTEDDIRAL